MRLFGRDPQAGVAALDGVAGFVEAPRFYPYLTGRRNLELLRRARRRRRRRGASTRSSTSSSSATARRTASADTRTGCASAWGSPPRCCAGPSSCCSTSPRPAWTRPGCATCALLVRRLADGGMTVLLSSHLLAEVEELCNRVAIVRQGRMAYEGDAGRAAPRGGRPSTACARPTTTARWRCAPRSRASRTPRLLSTAASPSARRPSRRWASCRWRWPRRARSSWSWRPTARRWRTSSSRSPRATATLPAIPRRPRSGGPA